MELPENEPGVLENLRGAGLIHSSEEEDTAQITASLFPDDYIGVYVDVGAGYPIWYSNSYPFRAKGWLVVAIEPQPNMCAEFRELGFEVLEYACSDQDWGMRDFEVVAGCAGGLGASAFKVLDDHPREAITTIQVEARRLDDLLSEFYPRIDRIDVLDIDVEYYELEVLRGLDFAKYDPRVLVVENLPNDATWCNPNRAALQAFYEDHGYWKVGQAAHNEILVRRDDE